MKSNNLSLGEDINRAFELKGESINEVENSIFPCVMIQPRMNIVRIGNCNNATSAVIHTSAVDKDTYLTGVSLGVIKDVTSTSVLTTIDCIIEGRTRSLIMIPSLSLTPQSHIVTLSFPIPIKVDRGSSITITNSTNVANIAAAGIIYGFHRETRIYT